VSLVDVERLREIAEVEFADIVLEAIIPDINELRIILTDGSFVDVWFSLKLQGGYGFHTRCHPCTPVGTCYAGAAQGRLSCVYAFSMLTRLWNRS
jgi:hypothetical protein